VFATGQNYDCNRCDGCGRRASIVDVLTTPASRLKSCASCFRELTAILFHLAAQVRVKPGH
jgi:hypothetical protein